MPAPRMLRRIDQRVLPPIGRALAGLSRGARRLRLVMVMASVLSVAVVLLTVYAATRSPSSPQHAAAAAVRIGVSPGDSIPAYVQQAQADLRTQVEAHPGTDPTKITALVSFSDYVGPDEVADLIAGAQMEHAFTHVPLAGKTTEVFDVQAYRLPTDISDAMYEQSQFKAGSARNDSDIAAATAPDTDERRRLRAQLLADAEVETAEANAYQALCRCVFAVVIVATPAELAAVASRAGVRVVDPAPDLKGSLSAVFAPPRPEESSVADGQAAQASPRNGDRVATDRRGG